MPKALKERRRWFAAGARASRAEPLEPRRLLSTGHGMHAEPAAEVAADVTAVAGRHVFYNNSAYDGRRAAADEGDDAAIAADKVALLPGVAPSVANVTSYTKGVNGVMVDVAGLPAGTTPTAGDFTFRRGRGGEPSGWITYPPPQITVRRGAGVNGSDRVTLVWPDNALRNYWVEVTVRATANTGLASPDVFYFGNLVGETGPGRPTWFSVDAGDYVATRAALGRPATIDSRFDFDRDGRVSVFDLAAVRRAQGESLAGLTSGAVASPAGASARFDAALLVPAREPERRSSYEGAATMLVRG